MGCSERNYVVLKRKSSLLSFVHSSLAVAEAPPSSVEIIGPFIVWGAPITHIGEIIRYEVRVTSASGDTTIIEKNESEVYHILARENVPTNLGAATSVTVQVSGRYMCSI